MKRFFAYLMFCLLSVVHVEINEAAATHQQSLVLLARRIGKCPKAEPPRKVKGARCYPKNKFYQWRWTEDGQIQSIATGLCVDVDENHGISKDRDLALSVCNFRKSFQKWRCQRQKNFKKLFFVNSAHTGKYSRWRFVDKPGYYILSSSNLGKFKTRSEIEIGGADLCDFNRRDVCLQTIGKIPMRDYKCFVFLAMKDSHHGHVELPVPSTSSLEMFTISVWVKIPPDGESQGAVFSYNVNGKTLFGFVIKPKGYSDFLLPAENVIKLKLPSLLDLSGFWAHLAFLWSKSIFTAYVNGKVRIVSNMKEKPFPGSGTLSLGRVTKGVDDLGFSGYITEFNIFSRAFTSDEIGELVGKLHCCNKLLQGDWLSWRDVVDSGKRFGDVRENAGAECTSFEALSKDWLTKEQSRWSCRLPMSVADTRFIPDHHFTASSSTSKEVPWNGRASRKSRTPWCPNHKDRNSYLQVDLGAVKNVTAVGTAIILAKFRNRYAKRIKVHSSKNGIYWKNDGKIYNTSNSVKSTVDVISLSSPVLARHLRFYATSCIPGACCLSVEVFGCDPELAKLIYEGEDGCVGEDKPFILMDLGEMHHVKRIQIRAQRKNHRKHIRAFYLYYMSWNQWIPYQIQGATKVFKGTKETTRSFVHILEIPILTRLIKIYPVPYAQPACGEFKFIGCLPSRADFCDRSSFYGSRDCRKVEVPQCKLGFLGNGDVCVDVNECESKQNSGCDRNSICKNRIGFYECEPCRNGFVGNGKICQTSCEALGVVCGENSFCDVSECKCHEGYYHNGTQCVELDESEEKEKEDEGDDVEESTDEISTQGPAESGCPDGFFNCFGDVLGSLDEINKASLAYTDFDHDECNAAQTVNDNNFEKV